MTDAVKPVLLACPNLFFSMKLATRLSRMGVPSVAKTRREDILLSAADAGSVVLDLSAKDLDPVAIIQELKSSRKDLPILGFCGHNDALLMAAARKAGCDRVVPNSGLEAELEPFLKR